MSKKFISWKTLLSEEIITTPWMSLLHKYFELPDGKRGNYFHLHTKGSALIIPLQDDGKIIMVKQYRYLNDGVSLEFPCGGIKDGQDEVAAAHAELREETGYDCKRLKKIGLFMPYNGLSDEICMVFMGKGLYSAAATPDDTEQIEVLKLSPDEIDKMVARGKILDGMSIAGWALGRKYIR